MKTVAEVDCGGASVRVANPDPRRAYPVELTLKEGIVALGIDITEAQAAKVRDALDKALGLPSRASLEAARDAERAHGMELEAECIRRDREIAAQAERIRELEADRDEWKRAYEAGRDGTSPMLAEYLADANSAKARIRELEAEAEQYRMRLAGALTAADGYFSRAQRDEPTVLEYIRSCPTIDTVIHRMEALAVAEARNRELEEGLRKALNVAGYSNLTDRSLQELEEARALLEKKPDAGCGKAFGSKTCDGRYICSECATALLEKTP